MGQMFMTARRLRKGESEKSAPQAQGQRCRNGIQREAPAPHARACCSMMEDGRAAI